MIMIHYYIYKITLTEGKLKDHYYIGQHKSKSLKDDYKGSGRIVKDYYKKYPNGYAKEILCLCNDKDELNAAEDFYVGDKYETDPLCLNLCAGGHQPGISDETRQKMSEIAKLRGSENNPMFGKHHTDEAKQKQREKAINRDINVINKHRNYLKEYYKTHDVWNKGKTGIYSDEYRQKLSNRTYLTGENHPMFGRHHTDEAKQKMSDKLSDGRLKGSNNPRAIQITINGKTYGCLKDAYNDINPTCNYGTFCNKYKKGTLI